MKQNYFGPTGTIPTRAITTGTALALAMIFIPQDAAAAVMAVDLGSASNFAVLAGAGITVAGAINSTTITGDIGTFPTPTITGLENVILNGVNHAGDSVTQQAMVDLGLAYTDAAGRTPSTIFGPIYNLGGDTLLPGVYNGSSSFEITGDLTLNAAGDPNAVWMIDPDNGLRQQCAPDWRSPGQQRLLAGG